LGFRIASVPYRSGRASQGSVQKPTPLFFFFVPQKYVLRGRGKSPNPALQFEWIFFAAFLRWLFFKGIIIGFPALGLAQAPAGCFSLIFISLSPLLYFLSPHGQFCRPLYPKATPFILRPGFRVFFKFQIVHPTPPPPLFVNNL